MDQFSDMLLSTMLMAATKATQDSDKVKCNAVRAVGNILRYMPARSLGASSPFFVSFFFPLLVFECCMFFF